MATARISESLWTCMKRWALELALEKAGHLWPSARMRLPMCGAELVGRLLAFLDGRGRIDGDLSDVDDFDIEFAAGWTGTSGVLVAALVETRWIDRDGPVTKWHDFGSFNSKAMTNRKNGRKGGRPRVQGSARWKRGKYPEAHDGTHDETHDVTQTKPTSEPMTKQSGSGSGDSSEGIPSERPLTPSARAPEPGGVAVAACAAGPYCRDPECCDTGRAYAKRHAESAAWHEANPTRASSSRGRA